MKRQGITMTVLLACLLAGTLALAGEPGSALKNDDLMQQPFRDAKTVGALVAGDKVEIIQKQGGWFQVKSAKGTGWVRMLSIRRGEASKDTIDTTGILGLASGRAGTGRVVATTGIRGLSEEDLKAAHFNERELKKDESFAVTQAEAQRFAAQGKLIAKKVEYLSAPGKDAGER